MSRRSSYLAFKAALFSLALFLAVMAHYQLKSLSRTLVLTFLGSTNLPYVWIVTIVSLLMLAPFARLSLRRHSAFRFTTGVCLSLIAGLCFFRTMLSSPNTTVVIGFYVLVDMSVVVLLETLWTLINGSFVLSQGERWYRIIGSGALLGGVAGGWLASALLTHTSLLPADLLYVSAGLLALLVIIISFMNSHGYIGKHPESIAAGNETSNLVGNKTSRGQLFVTIAIIILLSQLVEQIVEYQFLNTVESSIHQIKDQTVYLSRVFGILSAAALLLNLAVFPLVYRVGGILGGFLMQPLFLCAVASGLVLSPSLLTVSVLKVVDRAISYSFHRTSKELLYIPLEEGTIFRTKVWVDVFCYRLFALFGSVLVLCLTRWLPVPATLHQLSLFLVAISITWMCLIFSLSGNTTLQKKEIDYPGPSNSLAAKIHSINSKVNGAPSNHGSM